MKTDYRAPLALLSLIVFPAAAAAQTTWYVDWNNSPPGSGTESDPYTSLQYAIEQPTTVSGDSIRVAPGSYPESISFDDKSLEVISERGPLETSLTAAGSGAIVVAFGYGWSSITGFTIQGIGHTTKGVHSDWERSGGLRYCIIRDHATGLFNEWDLNLVNCDVVDNDVGLEHQGTGHGGSELTYATNTTFWGNSQDFLGVDLGDVALIWSYSLTEDPLFFGPGDYHLMAGSPCINAGDPTSPPDPNGSRVDIGALPYDPNHPLGKSYCSPAESSSGSPGTILISGSASMSANDLVLQGIRCPANTPGIFFYGTREVYRPWGDGFQCAGGQLARLPLAPTDGWGTSTFSLDLNTCRATHRRSSSGNHGLSSSGSATQLRGGRASTTPTP